MPGSVCATGRIIALPAWFAAVSGATHAVRDAEDRTVFLLRSRLLTLDRYVAEIARVLGHRRGWVGGDPAPVLEVTEAHHLFLLPPETGITRFATGGVVTCSELPVRGFLWL